MRRGSCATPCGIAPIGRPHSASKSRATTTGKKNEWGATADTLRDYEAILAKLALDHADLELRDFEPPVGTERLRDFIDNRWGDRTPRTRAKVISVLRDYFAWR
jgi:hypothetical protein